MAQHTIVIMAAWLAAAAFAIPAAAFDSTIESAFSTAASGDIPIEPSATSDDRCGTRCWHWYSGVEATALAANLKNNTNFITFLDSNPAEIDVTGNATGLEKLNLSPRVWLGVTHDNGWGVAARYWQFNQRDSVTDAFAPSFGDRVGFYQNSELQLYAIDLETTRARSLGQWNLLGSFGVRHARIAQTESLNAQYQAAGGDYLSASSGANSDFDGTGLVFGLQGYRPIVPLRCGNLDFFGLVRGSVLWGTSASSAVTSSSIYGSGIGSTAVDGAFAEGPRDLTIVEFQTGVQWSRPLAFCNGQAFARLALECQRWQVGNSEIVAGSLVSHTGVAAGGSYSDTRMLDTDLIGFAIAAGFVW